MRKESNIIHLRQDQKETIKSTAYWIAVIAVIISLYGLVNSLPKPLTIEACAEAYGDASGKVDTEPDLDIDTCGICREYSEFEETKWF